MTCFINYTSAICSLGDNLKDISQTLFSTETSPLAKTESFTPSRSIPLGQVTTKLPTIKDPLFNTRNNRLLLQCLNQLEARLNVLKKTTTNHRIGVIIGSSTSGILEGEQAVFFADKHNELPVDFDYRQQEIGAPSEFVKNHLKTSGPAWTISTACTSGAKALASAKRLIDMDICDIVIAGGADSLCRLTVEGFSSLDAVSSDICNPFSINRNGINIGEGAALFILSKQQGPIALTGIGETSDAYHISAPDPEAKGAIKALKKALNMANLKPEDIDYINLHGTATTHNDNMESIATHSVFGCDIPCSSTKPLTGHTLGAAGALEAAFCCLTLQRKDGLLPKQLWDKQYDPSLPTLNNYALTQSTKPIRKTVSNSFAFGGNNISLILEAP
ncbi:MAG: beta-ketoacyl-ACP synthase [Cellvibrionaceae bacterium]